MPHPCIASSDNALSTISSTVPCSRSPPMLLLQIIWRNASTATGGQASGVRGSRFAIRLTGGQEIRRELLEKHALLISLSAQKIGVKKLTASKTLDFHSLG